MAKVKDLTGQKFGKLTVIEQHGFTKQNKHGSRYGPMKLRGNRNDR